MENQQDDPLSRLKKLIVNQKTAALPDMPPEPSLQELHKAMAAYDHHVSETVIGVLGGSAEAQPYPERDQLEVTINQSLNAHNNSPILEQYQRYKARLDQMLDLALQVARSRA